MKKIGWGVAHVDEWGLACRRDLMLPRADVRSSRVLCMYLMYFFRTTVHCTQMSPSTSCTIFLYLLILLSILILLFIVFCIFNTININTTNTIINISAIFPSFIRGIKFWSTCTAYMGICHR